MAMLETVEFTGAAATRKQSKAPPASGRAEARVVLPLFKASFRAVDKSHITSAAPAIIRSHRMSHLFLILSVIDPKSAIWLYIFPV